jgi:hypothetical protein
MYYLWEKYRAWLGRRDRKNLQWWSRKRVQGKTKYILWAMFTWAGLMILVISAVDYYDGNLRMERLPIKILIYLFGGYIIAWIQVVSAIGFCLKNT